MSTRIGRPGSSYYQTDNGVRSDRAANLKADELTEGHWKVIRFLREDFAKEGQTATLRRVSTMANVPTKDLYQLFPKKPAKKMSYVSGLQKPVGCV